MHDADRSFLMTLPASGSDQRRFWDRQVLEAWGSTAADEAGSTPARRFAGDAHLYADQQYGSAARCADIRGVITPDKHAQDDSQWGADLFMHTPAPSQYDWLRLRGIHARSPLVRTPISSRGSTSATPTPPATHDAFYYGNVAERCEASLRQGLTEFADGPSRAFADVQLLLTDVQAACDSPSVVLPDGADVDPVVWHPELAGSGFCSLDLPVAATLPLTTGYHPAATLQPIIHAHLLAQADFLGTDFDEDGVITATERSRAADLIVEDYDRGLSVAQFNSLYSGDSAVAATNARSLDCTWDTGAGSCSEGTAVSSPVEQPSYRPGVLAGVPPLPSDGNRCWYFNPTLQSWRMKGADEPRVPRADEEHPQHGQGDGLFEGSSGASWRVAPRLTWLYRFRFLARTRTRVSSSLALSIRSSLRCALPSVSAWSSRGSTPRLTLPPAAIVTVPSSLPTVTVGLCTPSSRTAGCITPTPFLTSGRMAISLNGSVIPRRICLLMGMVLAPRSVSR